MSLLNFTLIRDAEPGTYTTRITRFEECKPENRQPYVLVEMNIDGLVVEDRWYASRIHFIMNALRKQFRKDYMDCTLSQLLDLAMKNDIIVHLSYDAKYGRQIDYREEVN